MKSPVDSLWAASSRTRPFAGEPLSSDVTADVAVVGGGFTGLSTALHLAEGGRSVVLLEAEDIGFGASGRNGGQVNPGLKYDEAGLRAKFGPEGSKFYRLGQEAPDFLAHLVERLGLDCGFERPGLIRLAHNAHAFKLMNAAGDEMEGAGLPIERLPDRGAVTRKVGTDRYLGGFVDPRGASVNPLDLVREMARTCAQAGVRIHPRSRATRLAERSGGWSVSTPSGAVQARQVVVATNGYTDGLIPNLAATLLPVNSFQVATAPLEGPPAREILPARNTVYDSRRLILYFRRTLDGSVVLGGRASFNSSAGKLGSEDYSVLEKVLTGIFPQLSGCPIAHRWTGLVCITADFLPHYHRPSENLHVVVGFNGRGVALSHRVGAWLARSLMGEEDTGSIPATPIVPIPLHRYREPFLNLAMQWNRLLDLFGR